MHVYSQSNEPNYYNSEPSHIVMSILNSDIFMYIILIFTLTIVCGVIYGIIKLHHIPKNKWNQHYKTDIGLISILSLLGWIWHSLWVVALIIAFINWKIVEDIIVKLIQKSLKKETNLENINKN